MLDWVGFVCINWHFDFDFFNVVVLIVFMRSEILLLCVGYCC